MTNCTNAELSINKDRQTLAIIYIPMQEADFDALYPLCKALENGTVFPELNLPFLGYRGAK